MTDESTAAPAVPAARLITIFQLMAVVLLWNSAYKGARVLNTLYALELNATPLHIGMLLPLLVEGTFERAFSSAKFLYTTREDLLAQAISFARASITGAWLSKNEAAPAEFSFSAIHGAVRHSGDGRSRSPSCRGSSPR